MHSPNGKSVHVLRGRSVGSPSLSSRGKKKTMLAPTPCLETNCTGYATKQGRCNQHQKQWVGSTRKARLPKDWPTRRLIVLKRDKGICHLCGEPGADTVDHIIQGDNHNLNNLAPVHDRTPPHCHRYKTTQEANEAKQGNKIRRRH